MKRATRIIECSALWLHDFLPLSAENRTDALINELMTSNQRSSDPQKVLEEIEKERKEMEEMFTIKAGMAEKLREQEIKCKPLTSSIRVWVDQMPLHVK